MDDRGNRHVMDAANLSTDTLTRITVYYMPNIPEGKKNRTKNNFLFKRYIETLVPKYQQFLLVIDKT